MNHTDYQSIFEKCFPNFTPDEMACPCGRETCLKHAMHYDVMFLLQYMRDKFGRLTIESAYRCEEHNKEIGGSLNSYHIQGLAADISTDGWDGPIKFRFLKMAFILFDGVGIYPKHIHLDLRKDRVQTFWLGQYPTE